MSATSALTSQAASAAPKVPARLMDIDITEPIPGVEAVDAQGRRTLSAWLLTRVATEPLGFVKLNVPDAGLSPVEIADALFDRFNEEILTRIGVAGHQLGGRLPIQGVALPSRPSYLVRRDEVLADPPLITVIVCTHERPDSLARCLESLVCQDYPRFRILIVDNAPETDGTALVSARFAEIGPVDYVVAPVRGLSHARNFALAHADGDVLASIDDDEIADRFWLAEIARALADIPEADAVTGTIIPAELETTAQMWFEQYGGHSKGRGFTRAIFSPATRHMHHPLFPLPPFGAGGNMAIRASSMRRLGAFDVALGAGTLAMGGEDTHAFTRLLLSGGTIVFQPSMLVRHHHRREADSLRTQFFAYGAGLTALYTSLLLERPQLVFAMIRLAPQALREVWGSGGVRTSALPDDFPKDLLRVNKRGMLSGPLAYLRGRRMDKKRVATP